MEFAHLKNTCVDSEQSGYGTELTSIIKAIEEQQLIEVQKLKDFFWDMFIADAFLGNFDRHNGNWGILVDEQKQSAEIAPVYDCGSCLYPQMDASMIQTVLNDENEINQRIYVFPASAVLEDGKKIFIKRCSQNGRKRYWITVWSYCRSSEGRMKNKKILQRLKTNFQCKWFVEV